MFEPATILNGISVDSKEGREDTDYIENSGRFKHTWLHRKPARQPRAFRAPSLYSTGLSETDCFIIVRVRVHMRNCVNNN